MPRPETRASPSSAGTLLSTVMLLAIIVTTTWLRTGVAHDIVRPLSNVAEIPASPAQTSRFGHRRSSRRTADGCAAQGGRGGARGGVGRARTGRLRERPSRRGGWAVCGSSGEACRSAAPPTAPLPSRRVAQTEQRPRQRSLLRPSVARAARALLPPPPPPPPRRLSLRVWCARPRVRARAAHGSVPAPTLHVRTVVGI